MKNNKIKVKNGESVTFDSTFPHFADNKSEQNRTILYLDVSLTDDEIKLL
jgi:aspartyl/asparaginyl beta-hydroxylase (cupin superfamily)